MATVRIPLGSRKYPGLFALIDEEDYERVSQHRWTVDLQRYVYYAVTRIDDKLVRLHRFIAQSAPHVPTDHVNGDGLDNRRANLRSCTYRGNAGNQRMDRRNTSGYRGVSWNTHDARWVAAITMNRQVHCIGRFMNIEDAARAYDAAAREHFGEFARLNFP